MCRVFPGSDYYEGSVAVGLAPDRRSHALPCDTSERGLGAPFVPRRDSPSRVPTAGSSGRPRLMRPERSTSSTSALPTGLPLVRQELEFKQCSLHLAPQA